MIRQSEESTGRIDYPTPALAEMLEAPRAASSPPLVAISDAPEGVRFALREAAARLGIEKAEDLVFPQGQILAMERALTEWRTSYGELKAEQERLMADDPLAASEIAEMLDGFSIRLRDFRSWADSVVSAADGSADAYSESDAQSGFANPQVRSKRR